jgi:hypothetical protein
MKETRRPALARLAACIHPVTHSRVRMHGADLFFPSSFSILRYHIALNVPVPVPDRSSRGFATHTRTSTGSLRASSSGSCAPIPSRCGPTFYYRTMQWSPASPPRVLPLTFVAFGPQTLWHMLVLYLSVNDSLRKKRCKDLWAAAAAGMRELRPCSPSLRCRASHP